MGKAKDITGEVFGRLTARKLAEKKLHGDFFRMVRKRI